MSEQIMRSVTDSARRGRQVVEPYQPVWMAHWMRPHDNAAAERRKGSTCGYEELNHVSKDSDFSNALDASGNVKESKVAGTKAFEFVKSLESEIPFQETDYGEALRQESVCNLKRGKAIDGQNGIQLSSGIPTVNETSFRGCKFPGEGTSKKPVDQVKTHSSVTERNFGALKPFKETVVGSTPHIQPRCNLEKHEFDKGKAAVSPLMTRPSAVSNDQMPNPCCKNASIRNFSNSLFDTPSTSDHHLPSVSRDLFAEMQKCSGTPLLPRQFIGSEKPESKKSHYNFYSLQKLPNCVHDMETMRICTTVDSVEATPGGFPRFSKTTHSLLITGKADANLSKEVFRTTQLITEMNGNTSRDFHSLWPFSCQANRGVKLQPLSSSSNGEEKIIVEDAKASKVTLKNESSADTDTMDMDIYKEENLNLGVNCTPSAKIDAVASQEVGDHWRNTRIPDINLDLHALPAVASSSENACASSSRTQSLQMDTVLAHAEQPKRKLNPCLGDSSETDPITRWVKRLKLRSSNSSSQGVTSPTLAENPSADKMGKFFRRILDSGIVSSEPSSSNQPSKETFPLDKNGSSSKHNEELMVDAVKMDRELLLSHAWIRRWLQSGSNVTQKKPETVTVCEPTGPKLTPEDDIENKQFPSIGAMALMGKALNGLQLCELKKRGSVTVWNMEGILKTL